MVTKSLNSDMKMNMDMNIKMDHSAHENHSEHQGYNKHAGHSTTMFKKRFYISLILTVPVLALSPLIQHFLNFSLTFAGDKYLLFLIASVIFFYGGCPFLNGAKNEIKSKAIGMMTLISLAISVAYFYSSAVVFGLVGEIFFWELATPVSYTHLRAHETDSYLVCRLL